MSTIRDMAGIFQGASKLSDLKVSTWDLSNIRHAEDTFTGTSSLRHVDVNNWQFYQGPKRKADVGEMLKDSGIEELDLSKWNTSNYEVFSNLFLNTQNLKTLNISNWDVSNASFKGWLLLFGADPDKDTSSVRTIIANNFKTTKYGLYPFSPKYPFVIIQDNMDTAPITNYTYWDGDINKFSISLNREQTSDSPVMNLMVQGDSTQKIPKVQMQLNRVLFKNLDDFNHAIIEAVEAAKNYETSLGYDVKNVDTLRNLPNNVSEIAAFLDNSNQPSFQLNMTDKITEITSPVKKGDLIPDTCDSHYDTDVAESDLSRTITRTINITNPKGETTTTKQTVTFTRQAFVDEATGKVTFGTWSEDGKHTFNSVEVPEVAGYTASQKEVDQITVTPDSKNIVVTIAYKQIPVEEADISDNAAVSKNTSSNGNTASQGLGQNQAVTGMVMHLAIGYDKLGNKTTVRYRSYILIKYLPTVVKINGRDFYKLADKDEYVLTTNITGRDRVLTHNAYIYNYKGQRIGTKTFKKGKSLKTYGRHFVLRDGKKYYRVGKGQYIKMANFR